MGEYHSCTRASIGPNVLPIFTHRLPSPVLDCMLLVGEIPTYRTYRNKGTIHFGCQYPIIIRRTQVPMEKNLLYSGFEPETFGFGVSIFKIIDILFRNFIFFLEKISKTSLGPCELKFDWKCAKKN
jgi:hypothetical protein